MSRGVDGVAAVQELPTAVADPLRAGDLGLSPSELLQLIRAFVVVEGPHDEAAINGLLRDRLDVIPARVLPMGGAVHTAGILDSQLLFDFTDAMVLVVLDNIDADFARRCWSEARQSREKSERRWERYLAPLKDRTPETRWLYDFCVRSLQAGRQRRVGIFGFLRSDIIEYLPVDQLVPGAESWESLRTEWNHQGKFKDWLHSEKKARIGVRSIERAVSSLDTVPGEFTDLLLQLEQLLAPVWPA